MSPRMPSAAVVGGGAFGAAAALELVRRGCAVTVIDAGPVPHPQASSTDTSKAIRADYGDDDGFTALAREAIAGWREWNRTWSWTPFHECGFLFLTLDAIAPGSLEAESLARHRAAGVEPERLRGAEIARRYPAFADGAFADGYLSPGAGYAESGRVVAELIARARDAGARVREGVAAAGLLERGDRVEGVVLADGTTVSADLTVVAGGAWTARLVPALADRLDAVGQTVLYFRPQRPERFRREVFPVWSGDISRTGWYGFPATDDGLVKVGHHGAGRPADLDGPRVADPAVEPRARAFLRRAIPDLADAPLARARECLYCDAWDGAPYVDRVPGRPGLIVAAGGSGHGFKFAPVLGPIVADVALGRPDARAARFAWRERGATTVERARLHGDGPEPR